MKQPNTKKKKGPTPRAQRKTYSKPAIIEDEVFERRALAECYGQKVGMCGSYVSS